MSNPHAVFDSVLVYQFVKRLIAPFEQWPAFQAGIIDKDGNVLKKRKDLQSSEKQGWGYYDVLILNLKKLLAKIPGGQTKLGTIAALALLLKESNIPEDDIDLLQEKLESYMIEGTDILSEGMGKCYVKPHYGDTNNPDKQTGWKSSNGKKVKYWQSFAKDSALKHAGLNEEAAANAVGGGNIAGTTEAGDDPPVRKKGADKYKRKNKTFAKSIFARNSIG